MVRRDGLLVRGDYALMVLICYVVLLLGIPSELIVAPLGAAGSPSGILGVILLLWWLGSLVAAATSDLPSNPVKWLLLAFATALLLSYLSGMIRPISNAEEVSSADRALLSLGGWCGIALVAVDGIRLREQLEMILRVLAGGVAAVAGLGALQFFFGLDLAHIIHIPGLSANGSFGELIARSDFRRVTGTTSHPIEFGVVLSATLPLQIHFARFAEAVTARRRWWAAVALTAGTIPLSVSRSGILGAAIVLLILFPTWPRDLRRRASATLAVGAVLFSFVVPGLLGTIRGLFVNAASDPSTGGRTADYPAALAYVAERPLFGRGFGTFIPSIYRTLDNQYLGLLVEAGVVGLTATVALFIGGMATAGMVRHRTHDTELRDLAQSLIAGLAVLAVTALTFDSFGFAMCAGLCFLMLGATGALWSTSVHPRPVVVRRLGWRSLTAIVAALVLLGGGCVAASVLSRPQYQALASVLFVTPGPRQSPPLEGTGRASMATSIVHDVIESGQVRDSLAARGATNFDVAIGDGSLMAGTDKEGNGGPLLHVIARAGSPAAADAQLRKVLYEVAGQLDRIQSDVGVPNTESIRLETVSVIAAFPVSGRPNRVLVATYILMVMAFSCLLHLMRRTPPLRQLPRPSLHRRRPLPTRANT